MRIEPLADDRIPFALRPLTGALRRQFGKVLTPIRVWAYRPLITWLYSLFMTAVESSKVVDGSIKRLVSLRAAQLIGCLF
jgi:hypothetical protein